MKKNKMKTHKGLKKVLNVRQVIPQVLAAFGPTCRLIVSHFT